MDITVAIRTLNEETHIYDCLQALKLQSLAPREIIVVDNGSTDRTIEVVNKFSHDLPLKVVISNIKGFTIGLNLAAEKAKTKYIVYLSADCQPQREWLQELHDIALDKKAEVVQGIELLTPINDVHYALQHKKPPTTGFKKIRYFNNTNTLYNLATLKSHLPFKSEIGGEDTLMSIIYQKRNLQAYICYGAIVNHYKYNDLNDFRRHCYRHAKVCLSLMKAKPLRPRIYLHSYYSAIVDVLRFIIYRDRRFLLLGYWRFFATLQGMTHSEKILQ